MGLNVLLLARYGRTGASSRLRLFQYLPGLDEYDIDVFPTFFLDDAYLSDLYAGRRPSIGRVLAFYSDRLRTLITARKFDVVWVEKEVMPWIPEWLASSAFRSLPLVVDFDDAWHLRYSDSSNPLVRFTLGKKLEGIARRADCVIVANKFLQNWAEQAGARRVIRIPTVVDVQRYPPSVLPEPEPFTIGWIGTPETVVYLDMIKSALEQVLARENTRLLLVGAERSPLPLPNVEVQPWSEATELGFLQRIHVGIMPLPHGPWEHGKSGYKLLQYMAASRPVVASPVGGNYELVRDGENGFFAVTKEEWVANIERFRGNLPLVTALGSAGREMVHTSFALDATVPKIAEILQAAAASGEVHRSSLPKYTLLTVTQRIRHSIYLSFVFGWIGLLWLASHIVRVSSSTESWRHPFWLRSRHTPERI
jgi:glycosyltransferase involved in cell wall biosynthesis